LGWIYYKKGDLDKALSFIEKASELVEDPVIYDHLGDIYYERSDKEKAVRFWRKSLEVKPEQTEVKRKIEGLKQ
jgi:tetratricopeptide (TPR) repeat protein